MEQEIIKELKHNDSLFFDEIISKIDKTRTVKLNYIPFSNFKRFLYYWSGVYKSDYTIITAGSGVGKSKLTFSQYIFNQINFYIQNQTSNEISNLDLRINLFALEESKEKVFLSCICNKLAEKGIYISVKELQGIPSIDSITDELLSSAKELRKWFDTFERKVNVYNYCKTSYSIFNKNKEFLQANGRFEDRIIFEDGKRIKKQVYVEDNPNLFMTSITDTINLLQPTDKEKTIYQAIHSHSANYNLQLRDTYRCQVVDVQQQDSETGKIDLNVKGQVNEIKNRPAKSGLADNKQTFNNANNVLGIYAPVLFGVSKFNNYDIDMLADNYRYIEFIKSRDGEARVGIDMLFYGATNSFSELKQTLTSFDYEQIELIREVHKKNSNVMIIEEKKKSIFDVY